MQFRKSSFFIHKLATNFPYVQHLEVHMGPVLCYVKGQTDKYLIPVQENQERSLYPLIASIM